MKKRFITLLSVPVLLLSACGSSEEKAPLTPDVSQMKTICELSVMDCYYHNVAKFYDKDAEKFLFWTKDKEFWIEYSGIVRLGVDVDQVAVAVNGNTVTVTLPEAKVLGCKVDPDSLSEDSYIVADGSASITADDQTAAFAAAQKDMENSAAEDTVLLSMARDRARQLLENYIQNLSDMTGQSYTIEWNDAAEEESASASTAQTNQE